MEQFSLDKWLENKSRKVVTRDGRVVDIYYSPTSRIPLIGRTSDNEVHQYTEDGFQNERMNQVKNDLFFADDEELTELQKTLEEDCDCYVNLYNDGKSREELRQWIKGWCPRIIDLARKELQPEFDKELDEAYKTRDEVVYLEGYDKGHEDALKDLPKWKKAIEHKEFVVHVCVMDEDMYPYLDTDVHEGEYYIELDDLKTLPKEE